MSESTDSVNLRLFYRNLRRLQYREVAMTTAVTVVIIASVALFPGIDDLGQGLEGSVSSTVVLALLAVTTLAATVKGTVGFGFSLVATPLFAIVVDPTLAVVVLAIPPWMINVFQIGETRTGWSFIRREWTLVVFALIGTIIGTFVLSAIKTGPLVPFILGVILLGYVTFEITTNFVVIEGAHRSSALGGAGFVHGFLTAIANFSPVLQAYLHTFERNTERYVGGLSMVFALVTSARIVQMYLLGLLTPYRLWLGATVAVTSIGGLLAGTYFRRLEMDQERFDWLVTVLLFVIAIQLFRSSIPALFL